MSSMMHESKIVVNHPAPEAVPPTWGAAALGLDNPTLRRVAWLACGLSLAAGTLPGCGQKGPLYLPVPAVAASAATSLAPSTAPSTASSSPTP
jgi:predicted small lipoprotein YifL